jgi:hypothetical protein
MVTSYVIIVWHQNQEIHISKVHVYSSMPLYYTCRCIDTELLHHHKDLPRDICETLNNCPPKACATNAWLPACAATVGS